MIETEGRIKRAFIGLGANLGRRAANMERALKLLAQSPRIHGVRCSPFYETEPVGLATDHWFLNAVAELQTSLSPPELLKVLLGIERIMDRDRSMGGDRPIDLDLLYVEGEEYDRLGIRVPHPRLSQRSFVLAPWAELAPDLVLNPWEKTVGELLRALPESGPVVRPWQPRSRKAP